jgi:protein-tyrosine kinase
MSIMEALERAKVLRQAQIKDRATAEAERPVARTPEARPDPVADAALTARRAALQLEPLQTVEISAAACEQNRILLTDHHLREYPQAAAAYRLLRGKVQQDLRRNKWSSLAVSSPTPDDGKTTTVLNIALSIAREKQRTVCVLDLDMRNPTVFKYLGLGDVRSVSEYLTGDARPEDVLMQTGIPNLILAGAMSPVDGASEMLASPRFEELIGYIRLRWPDVVVIMDLPPVNVTDEALVVAPRVDATMLVVSEGKTQRDDLARALLTLKDYTFAGVIINRSSDFHVAGYDRYTV